MSDEKEVYVNRAPEKQTYAQAGAPPGGLSILKQIQKAVRSLGVTEDTYSTIGLDVSQFQNEGNLPIDWVKAKAAGAKFAFIRGADVQYWDAWWQSNYNGAKSAGMPAKLYLVWSPAVDNAVQLDFWRQHIGDAVLLESPFALDVEINPTGLDKVRVTNRLVSMITMLQATFGFSPILYTGKWWTDGNLLFDPIFNTCPQWLADYYPPLEIVDGWTQVKMWQYTSSGDALLYGCHHAQNRVDLNYWIAPEAEYYTFWNVAQPPPPPPAVEYVKLLVTRQVKIREKPQPYAKEVGMLYVGDIVEVRNLDTFSGYSLWVKHDKGWSAIVHNGVVFMDRLPA